MKLRPRVFLVTAVLVVASAFAAWLVARQQAVRIVEQWAVRYAEKQVLYDKYRMFQPILREIALARHLAASPRIREWARKPEDRALTRRAIAEMEEFRGNFADRSYFVALLASGRYYHNNAANEFEGQELRYVLDPRKADDRWFYDIIRQQREMHLNVNPDANLGVTKLWIDVLIRDGNEILGVAGTGLDLTNFIREVVDTTDPGISSLFVNHEGAIQVYRDQRLIDYATITKNAKERNTISLLLDREDDRVAILGAMKELEKVQVPVITRAVEIRGKSYLAGVSYLPEIGWFEVTLLDLDTILPIGSFSGFLLVYGATLLLALLLFNAVLGRVVLKPMAQLERAMQKVRDGRFSPEALPAGRDDEFGRLMAHFRHMAGTVRQVTGELEGKVRERTDALERLTQTDPLTELLNRRGMLERLEAERSRSRREGDRYGLLLMDVDFFKELNDRHGHAAGDEALVRVARLVRSLIRPYDSAARWGGDEFLVLAPGIDEATLRALAERIRVAVGDSRELAAPDGGDSGLHVSVGATLAGDEAVEDAISRADEALYAAKAAGRDCTRFSLPDARKSAAPAASA